MSCEPIRTWLGPFHDSELDPARRALVEIHLGGCSACAAELAALAELGQLVRETIAPEPPSQLWAQIDQRLAATRIPQSGRLWRSAAVAALLFLAVAAGWMAHKILGPNHPGGSPVLATDDDSPTLDDLLAARDGQHVGLENASRLVNFRVVPVSGLGGYRLDECCVCKGGCCDLLRCKYLRGADAVLLVQCSAGHAPRCGDRPVLEADVQGKRVRIIQCADCLAATWRTDETAFSLIGPNDLSELVRLLASVESLR
jgi:hypothetical protein